MDSLACDGLGIPCALCGVLVRHGSGCGIYLWRELYGAGEKAGQGSRETAAEVAEKIRKIEERDERLGYTYRINLADPSIFSKNGADRSIGQIFRDNGVRWAEAWNAKGSRINGAQEIIRLLAEDKLKIFATCKHWLRTVPALPPGRTQPRRCGHYGRRPCVGCHALWGHEASSLSRKRTGDRQPDRR